MNAIQRYNINIICGKIKEYINERGLQDKLGLITYDFEDFSVVCVRGSKVVFTINVSNDEESAVIFRKTDFHRFEFDYPGIDNCIYIAKMYIEWEGL